MDVPSHIYDDAWSGGWRFYDKFLRFQTLYILGTYMSDVYVYIYIYIYYYYHYASRSRSTSRSMSSNLIVYTHIEMQLDGQLTLSLQYAERILQLRDAARCTIGLAARLGECVAEA